jgi:hypothetical protein
LRFEAKDEGTKRIVAKLIRHSDFEPIVVGGWERFRGKERVLDDAAGT